MALRLLFLCLLLAGCTGLPQGVEPVSGFQLPRYLGTWYEIARLDHSFERGLQQVSAEYSLGDDGSVKVLNRGYSAADQQWQEAEGKAYFVDGSATGHLKVSFFGPFYGSYAVFELDPEYQYAFVSGYNSDYVWLLARTPTVSKQLIEQFVGRAQALGFATEKLIYVQH